MAPPVEWYRQIPAKLKPGRDEGMARESTRNSKAKKAKKLGRIPSTGGVRYS